MPLESDSSRRMTKQKRISSWHGWCTALRGALDVQIVAIPVTPIKGIVLDKRRNAATRPPSPVPPSIFCSLSTRRLRPNWVLACLCGLTLLIEELISGSPGKDEASIRSSPRNFYNKLQSELCCQQHTVLIRAYSSFPFFLRGIDYV